MISKFFIEHPVLANVLAIALVLIGALCNGLPEKARDAGKLDPGLRRGDERG